MVREAEKNASSDKERREKIERKNQADTLAYQAEKQLQELGDKVPAADKTKVEGLVKEVRDAIAKEDDAQIQKLTPELQQALFAIGSNIYQQAGGDAGAAGAAGAQSPGGGSAPSGDDVIDADFTESK
jgi:molecular chaperone DnaK